MMNNEEEKRCPLCAEEMDWTDQQFMPCKCGYQICVWCWHHIIDMAEKDEAEGRCPACRAIYEKEKIVAMQASSERTMSKVCNRKTKPPKAKPKANEVRKDLTNIRVIQRKMVYVIGLPLSVADEEMLRRKEYFGQYGKVTKVSLSRTAGGAIQQFINDTCSVYITYSKQEEALRCIQSIHEFVLEGRLLRASFGTAKYCHAWLKNMPCNNTACLYLHSIGADEDSFGKDELAAVHTRSRVHQIVGATNNVIKRFGSVLPPVDDVNISCSTFSNKSTARNSIVDAAYPSRNSTNKILPCKDKEGSIAVPNKISTFVDIVGRSSSAALVKHGNRPEDRGIFYLCSELSSIAVGGETPAEVPCSSHSLREGSLVYDRGSKDTCGSGHSASFLHPFYSSHHSEDSRGALLQKEITSVHSFTVDHNPVNNQDDMASLTIRCVNSVSNDSFQAMKFQIPAKSDRIYRSSHSFSNDEIVEHLRRIDDDDDSLHNGDENSALDAVESSIISNILSLDFDPCEDSSPMPNGLTELLGEADGLGSPSWSSLNSDHSGHSFFKQDGFASQVASSILPECGDNKEQYLCKPHYPVSRAQSSAPPGFSMSFRDPPPGFSNSDRTGCLPRPSSGGPLPNASSNSSTLFQPSSVKHGSSFDYVDFFNHAALPNNQGNQTNGFNNKIFEARPTGTIRLNTFKDETRLWRMLQQPTPSAPHIVSSQPVQSFGGRHNGNGLSSRVVDGNCDPSFFSQQMYANGHHVFNSNGYRSSLGEVQHNGEAWLTKVERKERLGVEYFSRYGDLTFSSGDVYTTRLFGL